VLASIRKDGLLLLASDALVLDGLQLLTAVYLAGVLLPCLVTAWTIARERSLQLTLHLLARQITAALVFTAVLAWGGALLLSVLQ
jgi:ferrous iron transport protein B